MGACFTCPCLQAEATELELWIATRSRGAGINLLLPGRLIFGPTRLGARGGCGSRWIIYADDGSGQWRWWPCSCSCWWSRRSDADDAVIGPISANTNCLEVSVLALQYRPIQNVFVLILSYRICLYWYVLVCIVLSYMCVLFCIETQYRLIQNVCILILSCRICLYCSVLVCICMYWL
jgi:hypothetical protein